MIMNFKFIYFTPINNLPSINSQCPVNTQIQTINNDIEKDSSSAVVKRPHIPNEILKKKQNKNL